MLPALTRKQVNITFKHFLLPKLAMFKLLFHFHMNLFALEEIQWLMSLHFTKSFSPTIKQPALGERVMMTNGLLALTGRKITEL